MDRLHRFVFLHRRSLAALSAGIAVFLALSAIRSDPAGHEILVAAHDLPSGTVLAESDLESRRLPAGAAADHSHTSVDEIVGRNVAGPMRAGEPFTDARVLDARVLTGYDVDGDAVVSTIRVADVTTLDTVRVGDLVDVIALDHHGETEPRVVARAVIVAATYTDEGRHDAGAALSVVTSTDVALELAESALSTNLAVLSRWS